MDATRSAADRWSDRFVAVPHRSTVPTLRFQVNYLASFLLTRILMPLLSSSAPSRVVNVSSAGQMPLAFDDLMLERDYSPVQAYCQSKLAQVMFTFDLADELRDRGVTATCLHPASFMPTKIVMHAPPPAAAFRREWRPPRG
jgi:NAD(P)-dependent dehydrogenase (short-subunit alcohol dehydrogenase family)